MKLNFDMFYCYDLSEHSYTINVIEILFPPFCVILKNDRKIIVA